MNIGIVTTWYERGAAYVSRAYMNSLKKQGDKVYIYARGGHQYSHDDPNWDMDNVTYEKRYQPINRKYQPLMKFDELYIDMLHFETWLRKNKINILIFNEEHGFKTVSRVKRLGYITGAYIDYYKKDTVKQFGIYDFLLCNTRRHDSVFGWHPNSFYVPWGTDLELYKPRLNGEPFSYDDTIIFFHSAGFGGVNNRKGTDLLLEAFSKVHGKAKLIVHSQAPVSKYGNQMRSLIEKDTRIQFIEKTVSAPGLYHLGDVFVYPTRLEGIGLCVPEALACGLPVITTDNAPMNEFVNDGVNGLLVHVKETRMREDSYYWPEKIADIDDLAEKMQTYVDNRDLLVSHKKQARKSAETNLDWLKNASNLGHKLELLIKDSNRKRRPSLGERSIWWSEAKYVAFLTYARCAARKVFRRHNK